MNDLKVITLKNVIIIIIIIIIIADKRSPQSYLQVVITYASYVCSQHSFGLPVRMYGMHRTHFDHARLDVLSLVI